MQKPLTEEQRKVVEKNYYLISEFLKTEDPDPYFYDDIYGAAAEGLCEAVLMTDVDPPGSEAEFKDLVYTCMRMKMFNLLDDSIRDFCYCESLEDESESLDYESFLRSSELIDSIIENTALSEARCKVQSSMSEMDISIISDLIDNQLSIKDISLKYRAHQSYIYKIYDKFKNDVKQILLS